MQYDGITAVLFLYDGVEVYLYTAWARWRPPGSEAVNHRLGEGAGRCHGSNCSLQWYRAINDLQAG